MTLAPFGSYHSSLQASWHVGNVVAHLMKLCNTTREQGDTEQQASAPVVFQTLEARQSHISNQMAQHLDSRSVCVLTPTLVGQTSQGQTQFLIQLKGV